MTTRMSNDRKRKLTSSASFGGNESVADGKTNSLSLSSAVKKSPHTPFMQKTLFNASAPGSAANNDQYMESPLSAAVKPSPRASLLFSSAMKSGITPTSSGIKGSSSAIKGGSASAVKTNPLLKAGVSPSPRATLLFSSAVKRTPQSGHTEKERVLVQSASNNTISPSPRASLVFSSATKGKAPSSSLSAVKNGIINQNQEEKVEFYLQLALAIKDRVKSPTYSGFTVVSIISYIDDNEVIRDTKKQKTYKCSDAIFGHDANDMRDKVDWQRYRLKSDFSNEKHVVGTNTEICSITGSICAERCALVQLRFQSWTRITGVYIVSDSDDAPITPGLSCRDFCTEFLDADCPVVVASRNVRYNPKTQNEKGKLWNIRPISGDNSTLRLIVQQYKFSDLYPCISPYVHIPSEHVIEEGKRLQKIINNHQKSLVLEDSSWYSVDCVQASARTKVKDCLNLAYENAIKKTMHDVKDHLYPVKFACGIIMNDGQVLYSAATKDLEFGPSLDPICKLLHTLEEKRDQKSYPVLVLFVDQFGVLHSPTSQARTHLIGFEREVYKKDKISLSIPVLVHEFISNSQVQYCKVRKYTMAELAPHVPVIDSAFDKLQN